MDPNKNYQFKDLSKENLKLFYFFNKQENMKLIIAARMSISFVWILKLLLCR